jgi:hypothetical protein
MGIIRRRRDPNDHELWPIRRVAPHRYLVELPRDLLEVLAAAGTDVAEGLDRSNPAFARLFPPASTNPDVDESYQDLLADELSESRRHALLAGKALLEHNELSEDELTSWMQGLNALRLVLGTRLGVSEDDDPDELGDDHPDAGAWQLYSVLSWLVDLCTRALTDDLPPSTQH